MRVKKIEECSPFEAQQLRGLALREPAFLKPLQDGCDQHLTAQLSRIAGQQLHRVIRELNRNCLHFQNIMEPFTSSRSVDTESADASPGAFRVKHANLRMSPAWGMRYQCLSRAIAKSRGWFRTATKTCAPGSPSLLR